jgi:uncharacterized membrane protein YheB (UPF0754 family)
VFLPALLAFQDIFHSVSPFFKNLWVQISLLVLFATFHGYAGAWLAVRMLFRPRHPFKLLGITLFPQGMIPRHRDRLANAIGKAVGEELVSQDTILEQLTGRDFLRNKIQAVIDSYTDKFLSQEYPSLIEALPKKVREPVLDAIAGLQLRIAEHIRDVLKNEESQASIRDFVTTRLDSILGSRISDVIDDETVTKITGFLEERIRSAMHSKGFEDKVRDFVSRRLDDLMSADAPLRRMFTDEAIALLKDKANDQIAPVAHHLTEIAAAERTRDQIGALIKREVHDFYEGLPFFKKIFVSRENLLHEVDDLVNESLPRRIEETLKGDFFAQEARAFISNGIDNALSRPLPAVIGTIEPDELDRLKTQVSRFVLSTAQGDEMMRGISSYIADTLATVRPHSIDAILKTIHPGSEANVKRALASGLVKLLDRDETSRVINEMIAAQVDRLLATPIGRIGDQISSEKIHEASHSVTDAIIAAVHAKLPEAISEFNVGGVVREKINNYPVEKLEALVLSVAKEHLRTIEAFGALFGFMIGLVQALMSYWAFSNH